MSDDKQSAKITIGCAMFFCSLPASVIWYVLLGMILHKTGSGPMEWSLYAAYIVANFGALCLGTLYRVAD